jgi:hypothetical protein
MSQWIWVQDKCVDIVMNLVSGPCENLHKSPCIVPGIWRLSTFVPNTGSKMQICDEVILSDLQKAVLCVGVILFVRCINFLDNRCRSNQLRAVTSGYRVKQSSESSKSWNRALLWRRTCLYANAVLSPLRTGLPHLAAARAAASRCFFALRA